MRKRPKNAKFNNLLFGMVFRYGLLTMTVSNSVSILAIFAFIVLCRLAF